MKITKTEKSIKIETETEEDRKKVKEFIQKMDKLKSSNDTFNKVIENDLEG